MDTCNKISKYMQKVGYECRVMGVPKTIDNDLFGTDHCPGFSSAAKYIATSCMGGVEQILQLSGVLLGHVQEPVVEHALDAVLRAVDLGDGLVVQSGTEPPGKNRSSVQKSSLQNRKKLLY